MFAWYKCSTVCYAYLEDVSSTSSTLKPDGGVSRWYSRGWTLQELVAPLKVDFYDKSWHKIGTKWSLRQEISSVTGIDELDPIFFEHGRTSVAQKMSWASKRVTTREEDTAYCLLGILGIHLPLLYGEGRIAFRRLQEELIKTSSDQSLFAWTHPVWQEALPWGILAGSPASFENCGQLTYSRTQPNLPGRSFGLDSRLIHPRGPHRNSYSLTNTGLKIELPMIENLSDSCRIRTNHDLQLSALLNGKFKNSAADSRVRHVIVILDCFDGSYEDELAIGIILTGYEGSWAFQRLFYDYLVEVDPMEAEQRTRSISISLESKWFFPQGPQQLRESEYIAQVFLHPDILLKNFQLLTPSCTSEILEEDGGFFIKLTYGTAATLDLIFQDQWCTVHFGILSLARSGPPWVVYCNIATDLGCGNSLDICKKHLEHHGKARSDQDGAWTDHLLPKRTIIVSALDMSRSGSGNDLRDLVYVGCDGKSSDPQLLQEPNLPQAPGLRQGPASHRPAGPQHALTLTNQYKAAGSNRAPTSHRPASPHHALTLSNQYKAAGSNHAPTSHRPANPHHASISA